MQLRVVNDQPWDVDADVLVVPIVGEPAFEGPLDELDRRTGGELRALAAFGELRPSATPPSVAASGELPVGRVLVVAAGDAAELDRETVVHVGGDGRASPRRSDREPAGGLADAAGRWRSARAVEVVAELVTRGLVEGSYDPQTIYREIVDDVAARARRGHPDRRRRRRCGRRRGRRGARRIIGEGANLARTLSNRASNDVSPEVLADEARAVAEENGLWIDVIEPERATELGMGMFMAVGQGSDNPPRMIVLRSGGAGEHDALGSPSRDRRQGRLLRLRRHQHQAVRPDGRDEDGQDRCLHRDRGHRHRRPAGPRHARCWRSRRPSRTCPVRTRRDPATSSARMNGKMVDITNTDAEGRLILGDAMTYAEQLGATHIVDVATLTGAVSRALGPPGHRRVREPQDFYDDVMAAAERAGERYWQIPLVDDYVPEMESWYGDLQNSGSAEGSLVKSGLFLREFVTVPWVHLDIAGTAYFRKATPYAARGATGASHATLVELALAGASARLTGAPAWMPSPSASGGRAPSSGSPRTGSRRAGRSTTRSTRRVVRIDWRTVAHDRRSARSRSGC